jgi:hypothetical protein
MQLIRYQAARVELALNDRSGSYRRLAGHPHSTSAFARKPTCFSSQSDYRSLHCGDSRSGPKSRHQLQCLKGKGRELFAPALVPQVTREAQASYSVETSLPV